MPTINDVAKRAGVSPVTVSRVINDAGNVSPATRERVERAIEALGYVPNVAARSLRSKQTHTLALMVPDVTNPFWTTVARGVEDAAQSHGYSVFLYNTDENPAKQESYLNVIVAQRVDGVIIAPYDANAHNLARLKERDISTVVIDRKINGWEVDSVRCDSVAGARALVHHLISLGHQRIAMLSGPESTSTAEDRVAGYRMALGEAGIPLEPGLIRQGEYRAESGKEATHRVLNEGLSPTAICAANNVIAVGAIEGLGERGLRIPQDIALVCFDELPTMSRVFPFLTVVVQPAYDMGMNAAQLLLSRLDSDDDLEPRRVLLPMRLVVRHSCGSKLKEADDAECVPSLPLTPHVEPEVRLVRPLESGKSAEHPFSTEGSTPSALGGIAEAGPFARGEVSRLLGVLQHREADRVPYLELNVTSRSIYSLVLGEDLMSDGDVDQTGDWTVTPERQVALALRLGMDAVPCHLAWRPHDGVIRGRAGLDRIEPPPPLAHQLSHLERYLRAAQGTGVGVFVNATSFFDSAITAVGRSEALHVLYEHRSFLEGVMDLFLEHQERVLRVVCDRFGDDIAFVMLSDDIAREVGAVMTEEIFLELFRPRVERLIAPVKEHGKLVALHTLGKVDQMLPLVHETGFDIVHPVVPEHNDIFEIRRNWAGKLALIGNVPTALLIYGSREQIEETVREYCTRLAPGGGYVLCSSGEVSEEIPPENFLAMTQAVQKYGRYGSLGRES